MKLKDEWFQVLNGDDEPTHVMIPLSALRGFSSNGEQVTICVKQDECVPPVEYECLSEEWDQNEVDSITHHHELRLRGACP